MSENGLCEESCAHGIDINEAKELRIENSRFLNQREGHHIKSRAQKTVVLNSIIEDSDEGTASYLIEATIGGDVNDMGKETNLMWNLTRIPVQATDNELVGTVREVKGTRK